MTIELDHIIRLSLTDFVEDIRQRSWRGKEREVICYYAFGHLLKYCRPRSVLYDPRQIGIEVRVPKPARLGKKAEVCKDLVIQAVQEAVARGLASPEQLLTAAAQRGPAVAHLIQRALRNGF